MPVHKKKRAFEKARPAASTKLGEKKIRKIRVMGGNSKFRALSNNSGTFTWGSEGFSAKTNINNVVYHPSNNEYVRTNTITKNAIVRVESAPFRNYVARHYLNQKEAGELSFDWETPEQARNADPKDPATKFLKRRARNTIEPKIQEQMAKNYIYACISSRPGQSGRCDGYILEGKELDFYLKKIDKK